MELKGYCDEIKSKYGFSYVDGDFRAVGPYNMVYIITIKLTNEQRKIVETRLVELNDMLVRAERQSDYNLLGKDEKNSLEYMNGKIVFTGFTNVLDRILSNLFR